MTRMEGHIFQPVMSWIQAQLGEKEVDEFWTVRSQLEPKLEPELKKMKDQLRKLESRVLRGERRKRGSSVLDIGEIMVDEDHVKKDWRAEQRERKGCLTVEQVMEIKRRIRGLVVAPVDKCASEAIMI